MQLLTEFMRRVAMFVRGERFKQDLRDEIRLHLELREEQHREGGLPPDRARAMARRTFGNELSLREASEDLWGWRWFEYFLRDLRFGARALAAKPGFTVIAILALGLGTGATSAIFSVVN